MELVLGGAFASGSWGLEVRSDGVWLSTKADGGCGAATTYMLRPGTANGSKAAAAAAEGCGAGSSSSAFRCTSVDHAEPMRAAAASAAEVVVVVVVVV